MPKQEALITESHNLYHSIGFVLGRMDTMVAFVPAKAKDDFSDKFHEATGRDPYPNEQGLTIHPEGTNKYWTECRIIFRARPEELFTLFLGLGHKQIVKGAGNERWNINSNPLCFKLLSLGFVLGTTQNAAQIRARIPAPFLVDFDNGVAEGQG